MNSNGKSRNEVDISEVDIPIIKLKMLNIQTNEEDLEDVDWFFTEDEPLETSQKGPSDPAKGHCKLKDYFDVEVNEVVQQGVRITSLKSGEGSESTDDEFDDCFVDIPIVTKSRPFLSKSGVTNKQLSHDSGPTTSGQTLISSASKFERKGGAPEPLQLVQCSNDGEFDQCFGAKEYISEQEDSQQTEMQSDSNFVEKNKVHLDHLLKNMCNVKSSHTKVKNSSRHFKTIESTLEELTGDMKSGGKCEEAASEKCDIPKMINKLNTCNSDHSALQDMSKLLSQLKVKSSSSKVLNRSRHYKTIDSTFEEFNRSEKLEQSPPMLNQKDSLLVRQGTQLDTKSVDEIQKTARILSMDCDVESIARGLSHDCEEVMDVVLQVANRQSQGQDTLKLNESSVHIVTSCSRLLSENPGVIEGTVIPVPSDIITLLIMKEEQLLRTVVINGDLTPTFHHKGYQPTLGKVRTTLSPQEYMGPSKEPWSQGASQILKQHQIDVVLTTGEVAPELQGQVPHTVLIPNVSYSALQAICAASEITMATYITDISPFHICPGLSLKPLSQDWNLRGTDKHYISVMLLHSVAQTVVYSHPAQIGRDSFEQEFWRCVHSLSRALNRGSVLPGGGETEEHCAENLLNKAELLEEGTKSEVMRSVAQILHAYRNHVCFGLSISQLVCSLSLALDQRHSRTQQSFSQISHSYTHRQEMELQCYDEVSTKQDAWVVAMNTALTLLQIDMSIVTGIEDSLNKI